MLIITGIGTEFLLGVDVMLSVDSIHSCSKRLGLHFCKMAGLPVSGEANDGDAKHRYGSTAEINRVAVSVCGAICHVC
jgi:hypothetical protein